MSRRVIRLNPDDTINKFIKRALILLLVSSLFWLVAVVAYFEYRAKEDMSQILQTEYKAIAAYSDSFDESTRQKIQERAKMHNILAVEVRLNGNAVFKSISGELPASVQSVFNSKLITDKHSIKDSALLPSNGNVYLLATTAFGDKTIKIAKRLSAKEAKELDRDIFTILFIAISSIVLTAAITFPLVYSQYKKLAKSEKEMLQANLNMLNALGKAISKRDNSTHEHNFRVTYYSLKIAKSYGLDKTRLQGVAKGAFLHDVGKIAISDAILLKPDKLTKEEFEIIKTHVGHGEEIVGGVEWLRDAKSVVANHHERFDGAGYPGKKRGEEIPIEARIFAVADVFDALTSDRPYKMAFSFEESMEIIKSGAGSHFDKKVVDTFELIAKKLYDDITAIDKSELESVLIAFVEEIWEL